MCECTLASLLVLTGIMELLIALSVYKIDRRYAGTNLLVSATHKVTQTVSGIVFKRRR